jgi:hypothetical protein
MNSPFIARGLLNARVESGLTEEQMMRSAPSIFATTAHESRSARFSPIPTIEVVRGLQKEGFVPVSVRQGGSRIPGKELFTKHLVRFRSLHEEGQGNRERAPELVLVNGNDGSAAYRVMSGLFRALCSNGLISADLIDDFRIGHTGDVVSKVIEGTYSVLRETHKAIETADHWAGIQLNRDEREVFAAAVHELRLGDMTEATRDAIRPSQLIAPRRAEDRSWDLWHTYNCAQEQSMTGGATGVAHVRDPETGRVRDRRVSLRPVNSVDGDTALNRALWTLSTRMAELKGA